MWFIYSVFIDGLKKHNVEIDRRVLADLALNKKEAFSALAEKVKESKAAWAKSMYKVFWKSRLGTVATLENILGRAKKDIISANDLTSLDLTRVKYLGKKANSRHF